tara:strand:+ start:1224 stop:2378 length:1155 start_codon:yes stop_codon:yes gene_type:complete
MLEIDKLYTHLEYLYNEDLDYIDDIYNYLYVTRLLQENSNTDLIKEKMELLDNGLFLKLKYDNIQLNTFTKLLEKYKNEINVLETSINKHLNQYNKNIEELIYLQNSISTAKLTYDECKLNILNHKLELWWSWISNDLILQILESKQGSTTKIINDILVCKKIFKLLNIYNKLNSIEVYIYKLIIYDIKNYGNKYLHNYDFELLKSFYLYINKHLENIYGNMFDFTLNIDNSENIINYLLINQNMYYLDKTNNIVIVEIVDNIDLFYKLNMLYNTYKILKLELKAQFDTTQTIVLDTSIQELLQLLNSIIIELSNNEILEELHKSLSVTENIKNNYYLFINYLNNIIYLVYNTYYYTLDKDSKTTLENKFNYLQKNKDTYKTKI